MHRIKWIDIAKGILILSVIIGHTIDRSSIYFHLIFSFHMPAFFVLSGWTTRCKSNAELIPHLIGRLLIPYLAISLIWNVPQLLMTIPQLSWEELRPFLISILFASGTDIPSLGIPAVGMAWFLAALFVCRILFNTVQNVLDSRMVSNVMQALIYIIISSLGFICFKSNVRLPLSADVALCCMFLMWLGMTLSKYRVDSHLLSVPSLIIPILWLFTAANSTLELAARVLDPPLVSYIASIAGTLFLFQISLFLEDNSWHPIAWVGDCLACIGIDSMSIYIVHAIDWLVPWSSFPALIGIKFSNWIAASIRCILDISIVKILKHQ